MHGLWTYWHPDGSIAAKGNYNMHNKVGTWSQWDENGSKKSNTEYKNGKCVSGCIENADK
jgi:antitoxin component YwqK of YwqJK toxin-antitoxin module